MRPNAGSAWLSIAQVGVVALSISGSGVRHPERPESDVEFIAEVRDLEARHRTVYSRPNGWTAGCPLGAIQDELAKSNVVSPAVRQIEMAFAFADFDDDGKDIAYASLIEAVDFVLSYNINQIPDVVFSDEGAVSLEWTTPERGLIVVFSGERIGAFSNRESQGLYSSRIEEFDLDQEIPKDLMDRLVLL